MKMNPRRTVFTWTPAGWRGWALLALAAVPVLVLTFFFFAVMLALFAVVAVIAVTRFAWHRYLFRGVSPQYRPRRTDDANTFTVAVRDITEQAPTPVEENPPAPGPRSPSSPSAE